MRANPAIAPPDEWATLKPRFERMVLRLNDPDKVADLVGIHWTHVYRLLRGARVPRGLTLKAIREAVAKSGF